MIRQDCHLGPRLGAAVVVANELAGQPCLHTETQTSKASLVTTELAATQAPVDRHGQSGDVECVVVGDVVCLVMRASSVWRQGRRSGR